MVQNTLRLALTIMMMSTALASQQRSAQSRISDQAIPTNDSNQRPGEIVRRIEREFCVAPEDFGELARAHGLETLRELGELGREALLYVARAGRASVNCALIFLVKLGDKRAVPMLRDLAGRSEATGGDPSIGLWGLGELQDSESYPLVASFLRDPQAPIADTAIQTLGSIHDDRARAKLVELLGDPQFRRKRYAVVRALGQQRQAAAISAIVSTLDRAVLPDDYLLVLEGVTALILIRTPYSIDIARKQLQKIRDKDLQARALESARQALNQELKRTPDPAEQHSIQSLLKDLAAWRRR